MDMLSQDKDAAVTGQRKSSFLALASRMVVTRQADPDLVCLCTHHHKRTKSIELLGFPHPDENEIDVIRDWSKQSNRSAHINIAGK